MDAYQRAREMIDAAHAADPRRDGTGRPAELIYADRVEAWVQRLPGGSDPVLRLAARCQHLERWSLPRDSFPMDRAGYHAWRKSLYERQSRRAQEILRLAGVPEAEGELVRRWVSKADLKGDAGCQALEDAACLVFLEHEAAGFAESHPDYPREKLVEILRRTWKKMSPAGRDLVRVAVLPPAVADLLAEAAG